MFDFILIVAILVIGLGATVLVALSAPNDIPADPADWMWPR